MTKESSLNDAQGFRDRGSKMSRILMTRIVRRVLGKKGAASRGSGTILSATCGVAKKRLPKHVLHSRSGVEKVHYFDQSDSTSSVNGEQHTRFARVPGAPFPPPALRPAVFNNTGCILRI